MRETALLPKVNYTLAITAADGTTAKQAITLNDGQTAIRLVATADMFITFGLGASPIAAVTGTFIPANSPEYFDISTADTKNPLYVTGIVASGTGTLYASVMG